MTFVHLQLSLKQISQSAMETDKIGIKGKHEFIGIKDKHEFESLS